MHHSNRPLSLRAATGSGGLKWWSRSTTSGGFTTRRGWVFTQVFEHGSLYRGHLCNIGLYFIYLSESPNQKPKKNLWPYFLCLFVYAYFVLLVITSIVIFVAVINRWPIFLIQQRAFLKDLDTSHFTIRAATAAWDNVNARQSPIAPT